MINFNARGFIIPSLNVLSSIQEFETVFVQNINTVQRTHLFACYNRYLNDLTKVIGNGHRQWIDGGYTTQKPNPGDIDLVTFLDSPIVQKHYQDLQAFIYPHSVVQYGIDAYIVTVYPQNHQHIAQYLSDRAYWFDQFDSTKPNRRGHVYPKGFLEVII